MAYEDSVGLNVYNHYGPRTSGGTGGVVKTEGSINEFMKDLDEDGINNDFPVPGESQASVWVVSCDISQVAGTVSAQEIGGVDISGATLEAPVEITSSNSGVVALTGATGGKVLIRFKKYAL